MATATESETEAPADAGRAPLKRVKLYSILSGLALSGLVFLAYSQPWFGMHATSPQGGTVDISIAGSAAAAALSALALAGLALFGAITIAGHVFRVILGTLEFVLGGCVVLASGLALADPVGASASSITNSTGVSGSDPIAHLVLSHTTTAWPFVAIVLGFAMAVLGVAVVGTSRRWPRGNSRRYQAVRIIDPSEPTDPVVAWDTLSIGADPTADPVSADDPAATVDTAPTAGADDNR